MTKVSLIWKETVEILGVLGVVGSLIFVAFEIRQNTDAVRSATILDIARWSYDAGVLAIENPEIMAARRAGCQGMLTEVQRDLLAYYYSTLMRVQGNRFYQVQLGILDEETAFALGGRAGAYANPVFPELWPGMKSQFSPEFAEYVEQTILPMSQGDSADACR